MLERTCPTKPSGNGAPVLPRARRGKIEPRGKAEPSGREPRREGLAPGGSLCSHCTAKCCRYFALPIDTPETWEDFEYIRWFLLHDRAAIFTEEGGWYLLVYTKCKHLRDDNLCGTYDTRPQVCHGYSTANCEYEDDWVYDHYWETSDQVKEYAEAILGPRSGTGIRSPKPNPLKILGR